MYCTVNDLDMLGISDVSEMRLMIVENERRRAIIDAQRHAKHAKKKKK